MGLSKIEEVIKDASEGKIFILVDDEDRENEGDLCVLGDYATPEAINFMAKNGRGLICLTLTSQKCKKLTCYFLFSDLAEMSMTQKSLFRLRIDKIIQRLQENTKAFFSNILLGEISEPRTSEMLGLSAMYSFPIIR